MRLPAFLFVNIALCSAAPVRGQGEVDTIMNVIQLGDLVVRAQGSGFNVEGFVQQVMDDTTFQHAFLNTRYHAHRVKSAFRVRNKDEKETASLFRQGRLVRERTIARLELDPPDRAPKSPLAASRISPPPGKGAERLVSRISRK